MKFISVATVTPLAQIVMSISTYINYMNTNTAAIGVQCKEEVQESVKWDRTKAEEGVIVKKQCPGYMSVNNKTDARTLIFVNSLCIQLLAVRKSLYVISVDTRSSTTPDKIKLVLYISSNHVNPKRWGTHL